MIIFKNICELNYYKHEHHCVFMLLYMNVLMYDSSEAIYCYYLNICDYLYVIVLPIMCCILQKILLGLYVLFSQSSGFSFCLCLVEV